MRRRDFIKVIAGSLVVWPLAAHAQRATMPKIGFLHVASAKPFEGIVEGFRQGLKQVGYTEHENVSIEFRWANGDYNRLPALAAELVRLHVAVIVTGGGEASALAAKAATRTIPIVSNLAVDPVRTGLVASLNHPGGNITGVNILTAEIAAKRVGLLHDLLPATSIIGHVVNPNFASVEDSIKEVEIAASRLGLTIILLKASSESDIDAAFASIREKQIGALLVNSDAFFNSRRDQFVALAARDAMPAIFAQREFVIAGGLISYGTNLTDSYRQMGNYTGRILKGERTADLPIVQSAKFELVINLKTAKSLGLTVPLGLLNAADEVIE